MRISKNEVSLPEKLNEYVANMSGEDADTSEISQKLGMDENEVVAAVSFWRGMGLVNAGGKNTAKITSDTEKKDKTDLAPSVRDTDTRTYTGAEIADILEKKPEVASLLDFAQERLERIFSPSDTAKLVYLEDYILMTPPMIMKIIDYCVDMDKKSMRYVEKTALSIYDEGIETYAALEEYLEKKKKAKSNEGTVRRIMGIGERNFTSAEKAHIAKWFGEYASGEELITLAYEKTIASISKPSVPYMSKLLARWHESGYRSVTDVEKAAASRGGKVPNPALIDKAFPGSNTSSDNGHVGLSLDDFFENS